MIKNKKRILLPLLLAGAVITTTGCNKVDTYSSTKAGDVTANDVIIALPENELTNTVATATIQKVLLDKYGNKISDAAIEKEYEKVMDQQGGKEAFENLMKQQGLSMEKVKDNIKTKAAQVQMVLESKGIGEDKLKAEYEKDKKRARLSHILLGIKTAGNPNGLSDDEAKKKGDEILNKLKNGEDFATLAKEYSTDKTSAAKGGDLGYNSLEENNFVPEFNKEAKELKSGEVSKLVKSEYGYHIIKKTDEKEFSYNDMKLEIAEKLALQEINKDQKTLTDAFKKLFEEYNVKSNNEAVKKYFEKLVNPTAK